MAPIDKQQTDMYIEEVIKKHEEKLKKDEDCLDFDFELFKDLESYHRVISALKLDTVFKNPRMMQIIIDCLPKLNLQFLRSKISDYQTKVEIVNSTHNILKIYIDKQFERKWKYMVGSKGVPYDYPFNETCKNYSCALAIDMWVARKTEVLTTYKQYSFPWSQGQIVDSEFEYFQKVGESIIEWKQDKMNGKEACKKINELQENYEIQKWEENNLREDQEFQKYFPQEDEQDENLRIAREGTPFIAEENGMAKFIDQ